jgi:hypothetical protein
VDASATLLNSSRGWPEAKKDLGKYLLSRREKEYKGRRAQYVNTVGFWKVAIFHVSVAKGVNWLVRARCSGIWTVKRAVKTGLVDAATVREKCAACMVDLGETPELQHILLECTQYDEARRFIEEVSGVIPETLPPDDRTRVLLGGSTAQPVESATPSARDGRGSALKGSASRSRRDSSRWPSSAVWSFRDIWRDCGGGGLNPKSSPTRGRPRRIKPIFIMGA